MPHAGRQVMHDDSTLARSRGLMAVAAEVGWCADASTPISSDRIQREGDCCTGQQRSLSAGRSSCMLGGRGPKRWTSTDSRPKRTLGASPSVSGRYREEYCLYGTAPIGRWVCQCVCRVACESAVPIWSMETDRIAFQEIF